MYRLRVIFFALIILLLLPQNLVAERIDKKELQRLILVNKLLQSQIGEMETEFESSASLKKYRVEYLATVASKRVTPITPAAMFKKVNQARFVFLGDEHTTSESQLNTVKVLSLMRKAPTPVTLVLEWIDESCQQTVNDYLAGKFALKDMRKKIAFDKDWGFSWASYSRILAAAKKMKVPILLVERLKKSHSLADRDTYIAKKIAAEAAKNPKMRFLTVYGEYHLLGPDHLSEKCSKLGMKSQIILVGDAPEVYWQLLSKSMDPEKVEFAHLKANVFFIRNGTPLERSISYRNYLMKVLGWSPDDFEENITANDIKPKAAAQASFESLHRPSGH